jgi:hypothetical protein
MPSKPSHCVPTPPFYPPYPAAFQAPARQSEVPHAAASLSGTRDGPPFPPEFLDAPDVAKLLGVCERTVRTAAKSGDLPSFRIQGRVKFLRSAILNWAVEQSKGGRS